MARGRVIDLTNVDRDNDPSNLNASICFQRRNMASAVHVASVDLRDIKQLSAVHKTNPLAIMFITPIGDQNMQPEFELHRQI